MKILNYFYPKELREMLDMDNGQKPEDKSAAFIRFMPKETAYFLTENGFNAADKSAMVVNNKLFSDDVITNYASKGVIIKDKDGSAKSIINSINLPIRAINNTISSDWKSEKGLALLASGDEMSWLGLKLFNSLGSMGAEAAGNVPLLGTLLKQGLNSPELMSYLRAKVGSGFMENPHDLMVFEGTKRREFSIVYNFMKPANEADADNLKTIIQIFNQSATGNYKDYLAVQAPFTWIVSFYSVGHNIKEPSLKLNTQPFLEYYNCALTGISTNYGGLDSESFFRMQDGTPLISLSLSFLELERLGTQSYDFNKEIVDGAMGGRK